MKALGIRGVYRRRRQMSYHGKPGKSTWSYWVQWAPYRGAYLSPYNISQETFLKLIEDGVERFEDRE